MDFNNIREEGFWSEVSKDLNENFNKIGSAIDKLQYSTEKAKGLFSTLSDLKEKFPFPEEGDWALVGTRFPANIYCVIDGEWVFMNSSWDPGKVELTDYVQSTKITNLTEIL